LTSAWPAYGAHLAARAAAAEERVATVALEAGNARTLRHGEPFLNLAGLGIEAAQLAFVVLPRAMPQFAVDPRHARDEPVGFDGFQDRPAGWVDRMDLTIAVLAYPQLALRPRQARIAP